MNKYDNPHRIIICGSRIFDNYDLLEKSFLERFPFAKEFNTTIISGGASGADTIGETFARGCGFGLVQMLADWEYYGDSADYVRNHQMIDFCKEKRSCHILAMWDGVSNDAKHMIDLGLKKGLNVHVIRFDREMAR